MWHLMAAPLTPFMAPWPLTFAPRLDPFHGLPWPLTLAPRLGLPSTPPRARRYPPTGQGRETVALDRSKYLTDPRVQVGSPKWEVNPLQG
jgi:hypothetical protein